MRIIFFSLLFLVNGFNLPKYTSIIKNKYFNDEYIYIKNKIKKFENIKNKIKNLTNENIKTIKEIVDEEISTEWDFYNETWIKK